MSRILRLHALLISFKNRKTGELVDISKSIHVTQAIFHKDLLTMTDLRTFEDLCQTSPLKLECELLVYLVIFPP